MIKKLPKNERRVGRHYRSRKTLSGTATHPRLCIFRSEKHIYAQIIDDSTATTLASASSLDDLKLSGSHSSQKKETKKSKSKASKESKGAKDVEAATAEPAEVAEAPASDVSKPFQVARAVGSLAAKRALEKGIQEVIFDRGGAKFHGRVKALADGAREAGLKL